MGLILKTNNYKSIGLPSGIIRLSRNENPIGPSPAVIEAVRERCNQINRYEDKDQILLFQKLAEHHGVPHDENLALPGLESDQTWITVGDGAGHMMHGIARAFLSAGDEIIEPQPSFGLMSRFAGEIGSRALRPPLSSEFRYDLSTIKAEINERTRMVIITNPNNPTGTIITTDELSSFVTDLPEQIIILIDEAYIDLVEDKSCADGAEFIKNHKNVLMVRTLSKGYGIAGFRFGYALGQPNLIKNIRLHHGGTPSAIALTAAIAALSDPEHVSRTREVARISKEIYYVGFDKLGLEYIRSQAAFVLVRVGDAQNVTDILSDHGIIVINAEKSWNLKGMIRVSYGTEQESNIFVRTLSHILS